MDNFLAVENKNLGLGLKSLDILILSKISSFIRNGKSCYISNKKLSELFGESESTVKRSLDRLESKGIIKRQTSTVSGNGRANKRRYITLNDRGEWDVKDPCAEECSDDAEVSVSLPIADEVILNPATCDGRFTEDVCEVHNEPILDKGEEKYIKEKYTDAEASCCADAHSAPAETIEEEKRELEELSDDELAELFSLVDEGAKPFEELERAFHLSKATGKSLEKAVTEVVVAREEEKTIAKIAERLSECGLAFDEGNLLSERFLGQPIIERGESAIPNAFESLSKHLSMSLSEMVSFCSQDELVDFRTWKNCAPRKESVSTERCSRLYPSFEEYLDALVEDRKRVLEDIQACYEWDVRLFGLLAKERYPVHLFSPQEETDS